LTNKDLVSFVAFFLGVLLAYVVMNRIDLLLPALIGVIGAFIIFLVRKKSSQKSNNPDQDERTEVVKKKVMLSSLFWSYFLLTAGLLVWYTLGNEYIKVNYIVMYIGAVMFFTAIIIKIVDKRTKQE